MPEPSLPGWRRRNGWSRSGSRGPPWKNVPRSAWRWSCWARRIRPSAPPTACSVWSAPDPPWDARPVILGPLLAREDGLRRSRPPEGKDGSYCRQGRGQGNPLRQIAGVLTCDARVRMRRLSPAPDRGTIDCMRIGTATLGLALAVVALGCGSSDASPAGGTFPELLPAIDQAEALTVPSSRSPRRNDCSPAESCVARRSGAHSTASPAPPTRAPGGRVREGVPALPKCLLQKITYRSQKGQVPEIIASPTGLATLLNPRDGEEPDPLWLGSRRLLLVA